jgi:MOSC domain-containing protein YiiM
MMKVISVNVGLPGLLPAGNRIVMSGIVKKPVAGPVLVRTLNLDGDGQADLSVHGGVDKAVYAYPSEHYVLWQEELRLDLPWGAFGENLTITGLSEETTNVGDRLGIGTAVFEVSQPRLPCFKLEAKFQRNDMIKRLLDSRRTGFYLRVVQEGTLRPGESIVVIQQHPARLSIREITDLYLTKDAEQRRVKRALSVDALAASWRKHFLALLKT